MNPSVKSVKFILAQLVLLPVTVSLVACSQNKGEQNRPAQTLPAAQVSEESKTSLLEDVEDFDPTAPDVQQRLDKMDQEYANEFGVMTPSTPRKDTPHLERCYRSDCPLFMYVSKKEQRMYVYQAGELTYEFVVSTGKPGHSTPNFNQHPDPMDPEKNLFKGRIYTNYTSRKYNSPMPYAFFIRGGYAVHATHGKGIANLGTPASMGCVRLSLENAKLLNGLVAQEYAISGDTSNVFITVE